MCKQLVNVPVVLKAPAKEAGHASCSPQPTATRSAQPMACRSATEKLGTGAARHPTLWLQSLAGHRRRVAEQPCRTRGPLAPSAKASAPHPACAGSVARRAQEAGLGKSELQVQSPSAGAARPGLLPLLPSDDPTGRPLRSALHGSSCPQPASFPVAGTAEPPFLLFHSMLLGHTLSRKGLRRRAAPHLQAQPCASHAGVCRGPAEHTAAPAPGPARPSPAAELDGLVEPLLIHGLLHLLCLNETRNPDCRRPGAHSQRPPDP